MEIVTVSQMSINVVTGEAKDDPYGQGFASISATIETNDGAVIERLTRASREQEQINVRCAMLDVIGSIGRVETKRHATKFVRAPACISHSARFLRPLTQDQVAFCQQA